jgi:hypothetical protein
MWLLYRSFEFKSTELYNIFLQTTVAFFSIMLYNIFKDAGKAGNILYFIGLDYTSYLYIGLDFCLGLAAVTPSPVIILLYIISAKWSWASGPK